MMRQMSYLVLLAMLAAVMPVAAAMATGTPPRSQNAFVPQGDSLAQVQFSSPAWYAVVLHKPTKTRMLYTGKDVIIHAQQPERSLTIVRVDPDVLVFRQGISKQQRSLPAGNPVPGFPELFFAETVTLDQLHFQYTPVERIAHAEPIVIAIEGSRAVLGVEVVRVSTPAASPPPAAAPRKLDPAVFEQVRVKEVGKNAYRIPAADVKPVIENVGEMFANLQPRLLPSFSQQTGLNWNLTSAVADGVLNQSGFTVTNSKIAQYFGIEIGDTIQRINGHPVTSPISAYWAYQETVARNPLLSELRVDLNRSGTPITKTYQIR